MDRRLWPAVGRAVVACVGVAVLSTPARAHQVGSRFDAPLPLSLLFAGAAVTVGATALWLGVSARTSTAEAGPVATTELPGGLVRSTAVAARLLFFAAFGTALVGGLVASGGPLADLATVFVWAVWVKGVGLASVLVGSPWPALSPWRTLYDGLTWLEGRPPAFLGEYPRRLGRWPAVGGVVLVVGVVENLTVVPRSGTATAAVVAVYALVMLLGAVAFGPEWFRRADAFEVLYGFLGRVAPVTGRGEGRPDGSTAWTVSLRPPWRGATDAVHGLAAVSFVVAMVYTVSFDGFLNTPEYQSVSFALRSVVPAGAFAGVALYLVGLLSFVAVFVGDGHLVRRLGRDAAVGPHGSWRRTAVVFAPTVVPIAAAYEVAHNYPFVVEGVGRLVANAVAVVTASAVETPALLAWLSVEAFWASQVALVVGGHVVAVVAAHRVARRVYGTPRAALRAHLPLVALMVGYTVLSLWIVSRPVVNG